LFTVLYDFIIHGRAHVVKCGRGKCVLCTSSELCIRTAVHNQGFFYGLRLPWK